MKIGAYGTLRGSRIPEGIAINVPKTIVLLYHFFTGEVLKPGVIGILWMDNSPVQIASTVYSVTGSGSTGIVMKERKRPAARRCNAPPESVNQIFHRGEDVYRRTVPIPKAIDDYNMHMELSTSSIK